MNISIQQFLFGFQMKKNSKYTETRNKKLKSFVVYQLPNIQNTFKSFNLNKILNALSIDNFCFRANVGNYQPIQI